MASQRSSHRGSADRAGGGGPATLSALTEEDIQSLWKLYSSRLTDSLHYTDAVVQELWALFSPLLLDTPLVALPPPPPSTAWLAEDAVHRQQITYPTHVFYLLTDNDGREADCPDGAAMSPAMCAAVREQPALVTALLEYFMALIHRQKGGGAPATGYERVYCSVVGNMGCCTSFEAICAAQLGRLLTVKGTVVRMSPCRIACVRMHYRCELCGATRTVAMEDGVLTYPGACAGRCRGFKWAPVTAESVCEEVQHLKLQEQVDSFDTSAEAAGGTGGLHRVVEVELRQPFLEYVTVGDAVCVTGVLATRRGPQARTSTSQPICLQARAVQSLRHQGGGAARGGDAAGGGGSWSMEERGRFYEMARQPQWFHRLAASVAPALYGLDLLKEATLLAVLCGTPRAGGIQRHSIHLLLVGDPGLGKSQLLRAACTVAPRSAFVCAHTASSCGLTMTLARDPVSGEATFEAGAVVHGDGGVTCIDEIDKSAGEHKALLEVMEQETVSIAKAGLIFSMPVRTSLLAAGNPIGGRFDLSKPITANVNLSPALLSRFDIVVCLRDALRNTRQLTHHVLRLHRQPHAAAAAAAAGTGGGTLTIALVRAFIRFAREVCHPVLSRDACALLKRHYLFKRAQMTQGALADMALPITPRYLQALIRVSEARAKAELRPEVTGDDAQYAVELLENCVRSFQDGEPPGAGGAELPRAGAGRKKKNQRDEVIDQLKAMMVARGGQNGFSHSAILSVCEEVGCKNPVLMLHQLNEFGVLLQKGDKYVLSNC
ncbi:minichromosome maintenance protein 8 [Strigomonas culicis]|uniref:Minichromosome maintenance protein 8 n=1 Tax=Strigomonas culicis TaxID=28005 RepID=S9UHS0_9TRYP|nr:minichromosome maintenance protein 8 [Strigomonas culicis]|eukprot:EPY28279.1 minichromosome maintenance protein 8 [Strigomonas culicis]